VLSEIQKEIQMQLSRPWIPFFCHGHKEKCDPFHSIDISHRMYQSGNEALTKLSSVPTGTLIPSLIEKHSSDLASEKYSFKVIWLHFCNVQKIIYTFKIALLKH